MLIGGKTSVNKINTNRLVTNENINIDQQLEKFWTIESYGTHSTEVSKNMFKKEERRALDILEKTAVKNGNRYEVGFLWKNEETKLPYNRDLTVCSYHVMYACQSESTLYSCLNVKELLARSRREV